MIKERWIPREEYEKNMKVLESRFTSRGPMSPPSFKAYLTTSNQGITSTGADVKVQLNGEAWDNFNCYDNATNYRWTCPAIGRYHFDAGVRITNASGAAANIYVRLKLNNTTYILTFFYELGVANGATLHRSGSMDYTFTAITDYVEMFVITDQQPITIIQTGTTATYMNAHFFGT